MQGRRMVAPIGDRGPCSRLPSVHLRAESSGTVGPTVRFEPMLMAGRCADRLHMAGVEALNSSWRSPFNHLQCGCLGAKFSLFISSTFTFPSFHSLINLSFGHSLHRFPFLTF